MRFTAILTIALVLVAAVVYFGGQKATASSTVTIPSCHASNGSYVRSMVASASAASPSDIVPPAGGAAGKNWDHAHIAVWFYGCKTPPNIMRPVPPAKPADPNAGKYPLETGPIQ